MVGEDNITGIRQRILIIDDAVVNIQVLGEAFKEDYEIIVATNGADGLSLAETQAPDIILLDIMMHGMDGYAVCNKLKADPRTDSIPVIFVTAMSEEDDEAKGLDIGAIDYITKPFNLPIVKARVKNHLKHKKLRDRLEAMSMIDGLTGIANRRRFDEYLDLEWRRGMRVCNPISLILMDIDYFKLYNDNYGHPSGDECLKKVAKTLAECLQRPADLVARYGGEEFVAVLPDTKTDGALLVAKNFQTNINSLNIPHGHSPVASHVTISCGVATMLPCREILKETLITEADKYLYKAKQKGRNQIMGCDSLSEELQ